MGDRSHFPNRTATSEQLATSQQNIIDTSTFCGRSAELVRLKQWVLEEQCGLVLLLGIGGIGKSTLAAKLVQQIQSEFEVVVWRSLQNAPPLEEWLEGVLPVLLRAQGEDNAGQKEALKKSMGSGAFKRPLAFLPVPKGTGRKAPSIVSGSYDRTVRLWNV